MNVKEIILECKICGRDLPISGETPISISDENDEPAGFSCERCFYKKGMDYWKAKANELEAEIEELKGRLNG